MFFLALNLSLLELIILQVGALMLGCAIYFFYTTRKSLKQTMQAAAQAHNVSARVKDIPDPFPFKPAVQSAKAVSKPAVAWPEPLSKKVAATENDVLSVQSVSHFKDSLQRQQTVLHQLLQKIEDLEAVAADSKFLKHENLTLQQQLEELELALQEKESELRQARQQEIIAQQMASRIDEVYKEFDLLQQKITTLEAQATSGNGMALQMEDLQQSYEQLRKDLLRKQDKLDEMMAENGRLHQELSITEDKLAEANLQRQQLMKRTQMLQDAHASMHTVSESNSKLQKELRRIGELESMLSMMAEERTRTGDKK